MIQSDQHLHLVFRSKKISLVKLGSENLLAIFTNCPLHRTGRAVLIDDGIRPKV
jgi:hypothetical protein